MVPPLRATTTQTRRGNRGGYVEHDDFEGLPVRQWRQEWVNIVPPPPADTTQKNDVWAIELPHGMPKDANLLPQHTQDLLRAARSGRLYKRPLPVEEEEADADVALPEKSEKKEEDSSTKGFQVKVWKQIPRNAEGPTISHLAKRRKGTVTLASTIPAGGQAGSSITKATIRRVDAAGNAYVQEITLQEGQSVDGEIISTTVVPASGTGVNTEASAAATPVRRRPPPPKRKAKGPGRGRRKKLPLPLNPRPEASAPTANGTAAESKPEDARIAGLKQDGDNDETKTQDSEMADDDEGDEGEDDGDEGDEGDEGDDDEGDAHDGGNRESTGAESETRLDHPMNGTSITEQLGLPVPDPTFTGTSTTEPPTVPKRPSPLSNTMLPSDKDIQHPPQPQITEGSPLKNVVGSQSPNDLSPQLPDTNTGATLPPVPVPTETTSPVQPVTEQTTGAETQPTADVEMTDITDGITTDETEQKGVEATGDLQIPVPGGGTEDVGQLPVSNDTPLAQATEFAHVVKSPQNNDPEAQPTNETEAADETVADLDPAPVEAVADPIPAPVLSVETDVASLPQEPASQPVVNLSSAASESTPVPGPAPTIDTQPIPGSQQPAEEPEPESPDLFSGLEAALNQQGEPKEQPSENPPSGAPAVGENIGAPEPAAETESAVESGGQQLGGKPGDS